MRVYIETWIGTLDIHRNGGFNGVQCPGNMTIDGEQCYLLFSLVERGQGGHHYSIIEDRIPSGIHLLKSGYRQFAYSYALSPLRGLRWPYNLVWIESLTEYDDD